MDKVTWNENVMAADDKGNIGYWHPGLIQLKPRGWDERLPYPGTGEAEWRGFLAPDQRPQVVNPQAGLPVQLEQRAVGRLDAGRRPGARAAGRAASTARRGSAGPSRRRTAAAAATTRARASTSWPGTIAQQRPLATRDLRRARRGARTEAATVLDTLLRWNGSYHAVRRERHGRPGRRDLGGVQVRPPSASRSAGCPKQAELLDGGKGTSHAFDASNGDAYALRTLTPRGYRQAAKLAFIELSRRFGSGDPATWREPRRLYEPSAQGAGIVPRAVPVLRPRDLPAQHRARARRRDAVLSWRSYRPLEQESG